MCTLIKSFGAFEEPVLAHYTRQIVEGLVSTHTHTHRTDCARAHTRMCLYLCGGMQQGVAGLGVCDGGGGVAGGSRRAVAMPTGA